jgi:hypothetical protein
MICAEIRASGVQSTYVVLRVLLDEAEDDTSFEVSIEPPSALSALLASDMRPHRPVVVQALV